MGRTNQKYARSPLDESVPFVEVALRLGVSLASAYRAAESDEIPVIRVGRRRIVPREPFERMLRGEWTPPELQPIDTA